MHPKNRAQMMAYLTRKGIKKPFTPASAIQRPKKVLEIEAFQDFNKRNPKAGGGMLVQPGFGGVRQGYRSEKIQAVKRGGDKELLLRLVKRANEGFKYVKRKDLQVQAGYKRSTNITAKEIGLDTLKTKFKKAFDFVMRDPDKLVTDMFDPMTQVKKLVGTNEAVGRYLKDYAPYEESKRLIKVLAVPRSKSFLQKAKGLTLGDLQFRIDNNIKGDNLFAPPKQVTAETKIMEIVDRHIKQGGKKIKWTVKPEITKGGYPSFGESRFVYNGKEYGMGELINEARDDPNFKEFFKAQRDYKTLNDKIVTNPKTGEKIRFGNLMKEVYGSSVVPYNIDHVKSIVDEPFTSLRILPARMNKAAGNIIQMDEKFITNPELKGKYTKQGKEAQLKKIGYNFNQPVEDLIQAELKLADDVLNKGRVLRKPNEIIESVRKGKNYVPDFYSKTAKPGEGFGKQLIEGQTGPIKNINNLLSELAAEIDPNGCGRKASASGGRIGLQFGSTPCALKAKKRLDQIVLRGTKDKSEQLLANKILTAGRSLKDFASIRGTLGPAALAFTAATEAGLVGYDMLAEGKTFREAVGDSVFNYALGPKTKIDSVQERNKRFRKLGVSEEDMGKIGAYESALQGIEQFDKTFEKAQTAQQRLDEANMAVDPTLFPGTINELQKNLNIARANVQDLYRAGDPYQRLAPAIEPTGLAALQEAQKLATVDRLTSAGPRFLGKAFPKYEESRQQRILDASSFINPADKLLTDVGISYLAEGGLSGGDKSGPPPVRGPNPQGLPSLLKRVRNL